jgi:secreted Zn-dependent insulinase-like peptidase
LYRFSLTATFEGMQLEVAGYNQKIPLLVKIIFERLASLKISDDRFAVIKEQVTQKF